jgi:hypothetical protein
MAEIPADADRTVKVDIRPAVKTVRGQRPASFDQSGPNLKIELN